MKPHSINDSNNFIAGWYMDDTTLCDDLIDYSLIAKDRHEGVTNYANQRTVRKASKESYDCCLNYNESLYNKHLNWLRQCLAEYTKLYPEIKYTNTIWSDYEPTNIQHYPKGGGFKIWHCERASGVYPISNRYLVFMTYLNTVEDGGGTEFKYQNLITKAEKGLTLIWPSEWMHSHRGIVSPTEEKWIVTGWISLQRPEDLKYE
jgi:hypothetical protein